MSSHGDRLEAGARQKDIQYSEALGALGGICPKDSRILGLWNSGSWLLDHRNCPFLTPPWVLHAPLVLGPGL